MCKVLGKFLGIVMLFCGLSFGQRQTDFQGDYLIFADGGAENVCGVGCGENHFYNGGDFSLLTHTAHWNYAADPSVGQTGWRFVVLHDGDSIDQVKGNGAPCLVSMGGAIERRDTVLIRFNISYGISPDTGYAIRFYDSRRGTVITSKTFKIRPCCSLYDTRIISSCKSRNTEVVSGVAVKYSLSGRVVPTVKGLTVRGCLVTFRRGR